MADIHAKCEMCNRGPRKPPVPPRLVPVASLQKDTTSTSKVDYIKKNVEDIKKLEAKKNRKLNGTEHTSYGEKRVQEMCYKVVPFKNKPGFGKIPEHTKKVQHKGGNTQTEGGDVNQQKAKELPINYVDDQGEITLNYSDNLISTHPRYICYVERRQLIQELKQTWDETMEMFQSLPIDQFTRSEYIRNKQLEAELKLLEMDIDLLEYHPAMYIRDRN